MPEQAQTQEQQTPAPDQQQQATQEQTPTQAQAPAAGAPTPAAPAAEDVTSLPEWAQKLLKDTRDEAATYRTKHKTLDEQHQGLVDGIARALGLKKDDGPAAAAQAAAQERDKARALAREATIENAVLRLARKHDANPDALADSRSLMSKLADIDPTADDFAAQVEAAIKAALEANPSLKLAQATPSRSGGPVGGGQGVPGQLSYEDLKKMTPEQIEEARQAGRLKSLLGQE